MPILKKVPLKKQLLCNKHYLITPVVTYLFNYLFIHALGTVFLNILRVPRYTKNMLQLSSSFLNRPVMSLRTGTQIGTTTEAIINPNNLKIEGFYCSSTRHKRLVLLYQDIRDVIPQGVIVNDQDALTEPNELVRLQELMALHFQPIGMRVVTVSKEKIGKVSDYATEKETFFIQKLYVTQSIFKSFASGNLGVDRNQIVEITKNKIIIQDLEGKIPARAGALA